jgi:hypothetical protein
MTSFRDLGRLAGGLARGTICYRDLGTEPIVLVHGRSVRSR